MLTCCLLGLHMCMCVFSGLHTPYSADTGFKDKTTNFAGLRQLFDVVSPEQVDVPDVVWKHDEKCNGAINSQTGFIGAGEDL